jgi:uncharacterized protein YndB with AHSA1/START domain
MAEPIDHRANATVLIKADPGRVFDAWLDPEILGRFMRRFPTEPSDVQVDAREGGAFRICMKGETEVYDHQGRYVVIDRPTRLIFTWCSGPTDWRLSLVTVTFTPEAGGVRLDLVHEGLPTAESAAQHTGGWGAILARLGEELAVQPA